MKSLFYRLYTCPYRDRKDWNDKCVPGTCDWFTNHDQFCNWEQSNHSSLLWVSADPGRGNSALTEYLVDEFLPNPTRTVCYFFFKDDFTNQKCALNAYAAILRQLFMAQPPRVWSRADSSTGRALVRYGKPVNTSANRAWLRAKNFIVFRVDSIEVVRKNGKWGQLDFCFWDR